MASSCQPLAMTLRLALVAGWCTLWLHSVHGTLLYTACGNTPNKMCVRVDDATITFYISNRTASYGFGAGYFGTVLTLTKVAMGDPSRPEIVSWTDCAIVPDAMGKNTTVNIPSPGGTGFYNETEFRCHAVVRGTGGGR